MTERMIENRVKKLRELEAQQKELEAQAEAIRAELPGPFLLPIKGPYTSRSAAAAEGSPGYVQVVSRMPPQIYRAPHQSPEDSHPHHADRRHRRHSQAG